MNEFDLTFETKQDQLLAHLRAMIAAAIDDTCRAFAENMSAAGISDPPPPREYFASCVMQVAYCLQCGANVETFAGGDPDIAWRAVKNAVDISNRHWGSKVDLRRG